MVFARDDLSGKKFGRLTVVGFDKVKNGARKWRCVCDCGKYSSVNTSKLNNGTVQSCGCLQRDVTSKRNSTHGKSRTSLYFIWASIKGRCYNTNHKYYEYYGGRGIVMYDGWVNDFDAFETYITNNVGSRPSSKHSLDRIENDKGYEPNNLRWALPVQQRKNQREQLKLGRNKIPLLSRKLNISADVLLQAISELQ